MTKDTAGVLQVVLHAASPKTEGLLNQHLNSLHSALQAYGPETGSGWPSGTGRPPVHSR